MDPYSDPNQMMYGEDYGGYDAAYDEAPNAYDDEEQPEEVAQNPDVCTCPEPCSCDCDFGNNEFDGEGDDQMCTCNPCECETPPGSPERTIISEPEAEAEDMEDTNPFQLDEFTRAKAFFMNTSTRSGLSLYDHLSDVIRKLLDERAPKNAVDYLEEISMNVKRYRFQQPKDVLQDVFYISEPVLNEARYLNENWKIYSQWSDEGREIPGEGFVAGSFQNLLRLQYYLEQVNLGLPREEMFRLALAIKDLTATRPYIRKARLWGKVFGQRKSYYVVEAEINVPGSGDADLWQPIDEDAPPQETAGEGEEEEMIDGGGNNGAGDSVPVPVEEKSVPGALETFEKGVNVVMNADVLALFAETSGLPPEEQANMLPKTPRGLPAPQDTTGWYGEGEYEGEGAMRGLEDAEAAADYAKWHSYIDELMSQFPVPRPIKEDPVIPPEADGSGANRRQYYICNYLGQPWILLPPVTPQQINGARKVRWGLTGELDGKIRTVPPFPGKEGHFLKALLARASAGSLVSPRGFYKAGGYSEFDGEDDEDFEDEEEGSNAPGDDKVTAVKRYRPAMSSLTNPNLNFWVHHACEILPQGRNVWWNPQRSKYMRRSMGDESEDEEDEGEEFEGEGQDEFAREVARPLFTPVSKDEASDGKAAWTLVTSSSVFKEFQVVSVRSNTWPGSSVICTVKGKVDNIYLGDGQKFLDRCYAPFMLELPTMREYKMGPELQEFPDPSVEDELKWLSRLEVDQLADIEPKFVDNEPGFAGEGEGEGEGESED